jgi:predicted deacetylase
MPPNERLPALCVSIHDVSPHTWPQCEILLKAIAGVADIPVTLLVVPAWHRMPVRDATRYERALETRLIRGDELALHGYTHVDDGPPPGTLADLFRRRVLTRSEGEFAALSADEARRRLALGVDWFAQRGWPLAGFVAPAWLAGPGAWEALAGFAFRYTTTLRDFVLLPEGRRVRSPSLVFGTRNAWMRLFSRSRNAWLLAALRDAPVIRLGLHPADAAFPALLRDAQRLIGRLLAKRDAVTKSTFAVMQSTGREDCGSGSRFP